ncbi:MAG TPA: AgmX/PglI C-terminal domain-containing protein, partial [Polyangiaceae bacterium]|nr:AgmX/PglI C-terminal domain-containing protein [Polyangiaceae bacterium]
PPSVQADPAPVASSSAPFGEAIVALHPLMAGREYTPKQIEQPKELAAIRRCYDDALARDAQIAGRALLLVAVSPNGRVHSVADMDEASWVERAVHDVELRACLRSRVARWSFPKHDKGDLAGMVLIFELQPRPLRGIPPARELAPAHEKRFTSRFVNKTTGEKYAPTSAVVRRRGDVVSLDYPDGAIGCVVYNDESLTCRWLQTDYQGGSSLATKPEESYAGTWGYWPSDSDGGSWNLTPGK